MREARDQEQNNLGMIKWQAADQTYSPMCPSTQPKLLQYYHNHVKQKKKAKSQINFKIITKH